jgi:hypothetical protein
MKLTQPLVALALSLPLGGALAAQGVGTKLPPLELEDFTQTAAKSFEDYFGRAVLIEFFAHW